MSKRILIADDSLTIQKAFAMTFAGEDVTLLAARSADEGLAMARQASPELVIADAVMPGRSGYDLCAAIKSDPALRGVPVYILASAQNPYDESRGRQSGVDGSLLKPFDSTAIIERVKEAIAKGPSASVAMARPSLTSVPAGPARVGSSARPVSLDDDYGEISIDGPASGRALDTPPPAAPPMSMPQRPAVIPAAAAAPAGLRPSLIPGLRPGAPPPSRPGMTMAPRPVGHSMAPAAHAPPTPGGGGMGRPQTTQAPPLSPSPARTLVGLPATMPQAAGRLGVPTAPARPPTQPMRPLESRTPAPLGGAGSPLAASPSATGLPAGGAPASTLPAGGLPAGIGAHIESRVEQKMAAIAARGPEYEAIAKLSREIIEKIVWEVVPELAELIVREELQKRGRI